MMRVFSLSACKRMPWKNGGGVTTEIAIGPEGSSLETFGWRISMAQVEADGPFSMFPGIDRTLAVLRGNGIRLEFEDGVAADLDRSSPPLPFAADRPVHAVLHGGPIEDLNVMTRRGFWSHTVQRLEGPVERELACQSGLVVLVARDGDWRIGSETEELSLSPGDSAIVEAPSGVRLEAPDLGSLFAIRLVPA